MNNEQLTHEVMKLMEHQAKCDAERENMVSVISELREDIKSTKTLAEDVHILALNMESMQKTVNETSIKVEALSNKEFAEYTERKKQVRNVIISTIGGAIVGALLGIGGFLLKLYVGGM